jgi:DDE superfamily endonuclease
MNVQVLADPLGRLIWASPALPGAIHDLIAARIYGIIDAMAAAGVRVWADKGYQGAGGMVTVPYRGRWSTLSEGKRAVNRSYAKIRAAGEQASATLKTWRLYDAGLMLWKEFDRPGAARAFQVVRPDELQAEHWFELEPAAGGTVLRHTVDGCVSGKYEVIWRERIEPFHDLILAALLDNVQAAIGSSG